MAKWDEVQRDFSGGEISQRMFMRDDLEIHGKACLTMRNFMPTLQGTAVRTPGTKFLWQMNDALDAPLEYARIIPYITPDNQYALVEITPQVGETEGDIRIRQNIEAAVGTLGLQGGADPDATYTAFNRILPNDSFNNGFTGWIVDPEEFENKGRRLGVWHTPGLANLKARGGKNENDNETATISAVAAIPEDTTQLQIAPVFHYFDNDDNVALGQYDGVVKVGTTEGGNDIWEYQFDQEIFPVGQFYRSVNTVNIADTVWSTNNAGATTLPADTNLYLTFTFTAKRVDGINSAPHMMVEQFRVLSQVTVDVSTATVARNATTVSYTENELRELQFVQSPYWDSGTLDVPALFGNELVLVHPNHPPKRLYFNGTTYVIAEIPFQWVDEDGNGKADPPTSPSDTFWPNGNYPAACTSYLGRLVLAGSNKNPALGSLTGSNTERVWMTYVGKWSAFSSPSNTTVTPADSIEFSSTYRSPIQWVHGQTNLLVGSESYEYVSNSDGIYGPGDLGVFLQSTHGSEPVQPAPMGQYVLFAAEQGARVRAMQYVAESEYWIAPDMTLYHPDLFARNGGIKRMVRMRNPHQMCICLMGSGDLAVLHQDSYANISGWSTIHLGNTIEDICVLPQSDGSDILYLLIKRQVRIGTTPGMVERLYLEAMSDWTYGEENSWFYLRSAVTYIPTTAGNVIEGLEHLNGRNVQVVSEGNYLGTWQVNNNTLTMVDGVGDPIEVSTAVIGANHGCRLRTMPLVTDDPGSRKRYSSLYVRCRNSARPMINGDRPADRDPQIVLGESQDMDIIQDYETEDFGWDRTQVVDIDENLPVRVEVVGIFGQVKSNST